MTTEDKDKPSVDTGLLCLVLLAHYHHIPAEAGALQHEFGHPGLNFSDQHILRAAQSLNLKSKMVTADWEQLSELPLPAIAKDNNDGYFICAQYRSDVEKILIQDANQQTPELIDCSQFTERWSGHLILLAKRNHCLKESQHFNLSWFAPRILKYRTLFMEILAASLFIQLFALITPLFFQVMIDKVLVHQGLTTLDVLALGLLVVSVFEVLLTGLRTYVLAHTSNRIDVSLGADLFNHLLKLPIRYFEERRVGDTVARVRELEAIRHVLTGTSLTLLIDMLFTLVFIVVMYLYSPELCYIVVFAIPLYVLLAIIITPILRHRLSEKFNRGAENQAFLVESITGVITVKANALEPQWQRRWEEQLAAYVEANFKAIQTSNIANQIASLINKITVVLILWAGARLVINGQLSVGQLVAFNMLSARVSGPILRLVQSWQDFQQLHISMRRLGDILNSKTEPGYSLLQSSLPTLKGQITFEQVSFRYQAQGPDIIHQLSLNIPAGKVLGIVGSSGSGKSTITKLLQRLYLPDQGRVLVDGVDLASVDSTWLRRNIGVVLQENFLFNRSVRENIAVSEPSIAMERVVPIAKIAGAHDFIMQLPGGYDSIIEEHGSNLSGGQRQRIAIARALMNNPKVLIFDEATSALDYESESIIRHNMRYMAQNRTVIIIAHRLSAVRDADHIIVLDQGQIVEGGTHQQLLDRHGYYEKLCQLQA